MRTLSLCLTACALLGSAALARAGDSTAPCPAPVPCQSGWYEKLKAAIHCPSLCRPSRSDRFWCCWNSWERFKEWACYRAPCGPGIEACCPRPNCECAPSPYVFFLDRCQPRAGDCPRCPTPCEEPRGPGVCERLKGHLAEGLPSLRLNCRPARSLRDLFGHSRECTDEPCVDGSGEGKVRFGWLREHLGL